MNNDKYRVANYLEKYLSLGIFILVLSLASTSEASEVRFGSIIPGVGLIKKQVISMRERRYVNMVKQNTDFSCGAASLATILKYAYGRDVNEEEVLRGLLEVSNPEEVRRKGFSLLDIKRYTKSLGMRGRGYKVKPGTLKRIKIPVIVLIDIRGYKHFVVFQTLRDNKVYLADPALGNKIIPFDDFLKIWKDRVVFAVIGKDFNRNTVLMNPPEPLTARGLARVHVPPSSNDLLRFGFTHADLF